MNEVYPYLKDLNFLKSLVIQPIQSIFVKFTSLDWEENPLCEIQGLATSGSLNLNGQSAIRRTCNISITIPDETDYQINSQYTIKQLIGVDNKIDLEIGYLNTTGEYTDFSILWFPLGLFVITQSSYSHSLSGLNVSLQLQDKMCLLNGTCGGVLPAETNFSKVDEIDKDGKYGTKSLTLYQIIQEAVNHWGGESLENIVISDIPAKIQKMVVWNPPIDEKTKTKNPIYFLFSNIWSKKDGVAIESPPPYKNRSTNDNLAAIMIGNNFDTGEWVYINEQYFYEVIIPFLRDWNVPEEDLPSWPFVPTTDLEILSIGSRTHWIGFDALDPIGSQYTDFIYSDDLVVRAGGNLCEVLDKIKNYLGNFEYFYKDNKFYFREKKNYINTRKSTIDLATYNQLRDSLVEAEKESEMSRFPAESMNAMPLDVVNFNSADYFLQNINDNSLLSFDNAQLITSYSNTPQYSKIKNDFIVWGTKKTTDGKTKKIRYHLVFDHKPKVGNTYSVIFMPMETGIVGGYLQYDRVAKMPYVYSSIEAFPKVGIEGLIYYDKTNNQYYIWDTNLEHPIYVKEKFTPVNITTKDWRDELFLSGMLAEVNGGIPNDYYVELKEEWPKIYDTEHGKFRDEFRLNPGNFDYFLDFIDTNGLAGDISVSKIGHRIKVEDSDKINCLFEPVYPNFIFVNQSEYDSVEDQEIFIKNFERQGLVCLVVPDSLYDSFSSAVTSTNAAYLEARDLMMEYSGFKENISIQCLPMYFIEPNTRVTIEDKASEISGDYEINSISLPLTAGGTMSISASKIIDRL